MPSPSKFSKWDKRFLELAKLVASWSKDPSTQVGSVIVDEKNRIISLGFNGLAHGVKDAQHKLHNRDIKYPSTIHAEVNAILFAQRNLENYTLYVWPLSPCAPCASKIIQVGIKKVVSININDSQMSSRWSASHKLANEMFKEANVELDLKPFNFLNPEIK